LTFTVSAILVKHRLKHTVVDIQNQLMWTFVRSRPVAKIDDAPAACNSIQSFPNVVVVGTNNRF